MQIETSIYTDQIQALFLNKPEGVINFPEWLLSTRRIENYRAIPRLALVEIAGRDSIAAAVKSVEENNFTDLLPTYVYTGTEYGKWNSLDLAVHRLKTRLTSVKIHDLIVMGSPDFWKALNGTLINELISRYGFYTPCIGCHLYLHAVRIPLALRLGNVPIISGERERHNGSVKINQTSEVIDIYRNFSKMFGVRLLVPLRKINPGQDIEALLQTAWEQDKEQLECTLSGNYRSINGSIDIRESQVDRFFKEFGLPCSDKIIKEYIFGQVPNHREIAKHILRNLSSHGSIS